MSLLPCKCSPEHQGRQQGAVLRHPLLEEYTSPFSQRTGDVCDRNAHCPIISIYGDHSDETEMLRHFRDNVLNQTQEGKEFINLYYQWSPAIVKVMEENEEFKAEVKGMIDAVLPVIEKAVE
jgi:hypothetical protein